MSGRYEPHDEYLSCDLPSWHEMPSHWHIGRIKFMTMMNPSKSEVRHLKSDTPVTFLPMESIGDDGSLDVSKERPLHSVLSGYTYLAEGDVCVAKITPCFENGKGAIALGLRNGIGFATTEVIPMRCNRTTDSQFLYYFLTCAPFNLDAEASMYGAGGQKRVADSFVANYSAAFPPLPEQKQIAAFLDYETAKIDALIEKQQQLIALLGEKRQAVISHAVTKGLNPDAPMRDSGIEWLGEVPEHWSVQKLFWLTNRVGDGLHGTPTYSDSTGLFFINGNNLENGSVVITSQTREVSETEFKKHFISMSEATVLLSINGTIGKVAVYRGEQIVLGKSAAYINCKPILVPSFLMLFLESANATKYYHLVSTGTTISNLSLESIRQLKIGFPDESEQLEIVAECQKATDKFNKLIGNAKNVAELLQERRTALISAAVTGKIDVRGWKPPSFGVKQETEMEVA